MAKEKKPTITLRIHLQTPQGTTEAKREFTDHATAYRTFQQLLDVAESLADAEKK
jgi:hypothetical protein